MEIRASPPVVIGIVIKTHSMKGFDDINSPHQSSNNIFSHLNSNLLHQPSAPPLQPFLPFLKQELKKTKEMLEPQVAALFPMVTLLLVSAVHPKSRPKIAARPT